MQKTITTEVLANGTGNKPESIRSHLYRKGHYYGLKPTRLPNGRLIWPGNSIEQLTASKGG